MILIGVLAAIIGTAGALSIDWFPGASARSAGEIDTVYDVLLIASVPIFVLVMTVAIYSVVKFRARPGDMSDGAPIHGNTRLEIVWVTIPFLLVTALAIYGWVVLTNVESPNPLIGQFRRRSARVLLICIIRLGNVARQSVEKEARQRI